MALQDRELALHCSGYRAAPPLSANAVELSAECASPADATGVRRSRVGNRESGIGRREPGNDLTEERHPIDGGVPL